MNLDTSLKPSDLPICKPPAERFREIAKTSGIRRAPAGFLKALAVAVTTLAVSNVIAQTASDPDYFVAPAAHTQAEAYVNGVRRVDFAVDAQLLGDLSDLGFPRESSSSYLGAATYAEASANRFATLADSQSAESSGAAFAHWLFIARDPRGRPEVRLSLKGKAAASAASASDGTTSGARFTVTVCLPGAPGAIWYDDLGHLAVGPPQCGGISYPYRAYGNVIAGALVPGGSKTVKTIEEFGVPLTVEGTGGSVSMDIDYDVAVIPGLPYLVTVMSSAGGTAVSVVDPVLEPATVNEDVTIEFPHLAVNPNPRPLMGDLTPELLAAVGLDPQPFVDLGFFGPTSDQPPSDLPPSDPPSGEPPSDPPSGEPPSDPPPPGDTPPPVDKDWCGPGFWLNNATRYGASAWPGAIPTYYDYNSTAGQMVGCPTARNNPSLLQALQNPDAHFDGNRKGDGFNCVADFLSGNAGLGGTKSDNSGVCSIDQLGRRK